MRIITPTKIEQVAWKGHLEPLGEVYDSAESLPLVTLGEVVWWPAEAAMESETGKQWTLPIGNKRYTLVRLACTLHPPDNSRTHYTEATLLTYLRPRQGTGTVVAHDLFPQRLTANSKETFSVILDPRLKFAQISAGVMKVGTEIEYHHAFPVIQGYGLGESNPYWRFTHHAKSPLLGCQSVYMVLAAPQDGKGVRLSLELVATLETRWGPIRAGLPEDVRTHLSRTINS